MSTYRRIRHTPPHLVGTAAIRCGAVAAGKAARGAHFHFVRRRVHGHAPARKVLLQLQRLGGVERRRRVNLGDCAYKHGTIETVQGTLLHSFPGNCDLLCLLRNSSKSNFSPPLIQQSCLGFHFLQVFYSPARRLCRYKE